MTIDTYTKTYTFLHITPHRPSPPLATLHLLLPSCPPSHRHGEPTRARTTSEGRAASPTPSPLRKHQLVAADPFVCLGTHEAPVLTSLRTPRGHRCRAPHAHHRRVRESIRASLGLHHTESHGARVCLSSQLLSYLQVNRARRSATGYGKSGIRRLRPTLIYAHGIGHLNPIVLPLDTLTPARSILLAGEERQRPYQHT